MASGAYLSSFERIETKNNWVNFPNMLPGEYSFNVNVGNNHGIWNESPRTIRFIIKKHYIKSYYLTSKLENNYYFIKVMLSDDKNKEKYPHRDSQILRDLWSPSGIFEPRSPDPKSGMIDRYTMGL